MFDVKVILGATSVVACLAQYIPYIRNVIKGRTRPHIFSWFIWGLPAGIVFAAQLLNGGGAGSWVTGLTAFLCTVVFLLSLFYGDRDIALLDWISFALALAAIGLWIITDSPLWSVILVTVSDVLGFVPTVRKSIVKPYEETLSSYLIGGLKWVLSMFALGAFSWTVWLYPLAMIAANWAGAVVIFVRRRQLLAQPS